MRMRGRVIAIQVCPGHRQPMRALASATLDDGVGLRGDAHAHPGSKRQVLIADREVLDALHLEPGSIKENLTVEGVDVMRLPVGTRLRIGASAMVEITSVCEPCFRMDELRAGLRVALEGQRGMNSRVLAGGPIACGDPIRIDMPESVLS